MDGPGALVVARFLDGRLLKGRSTDFGPRREFTIRTEDATEPVVVDVSDLKAIFFIKTLDGDPAHEERKDYRGPGLGRPIWIQFLDGEELAGWSMTYSPDQTAFRLFPVDPHSNIEVVYVFNSALRRVLTDEDAEIASREYRVRKQRGPHREAVGPQNWTRFIE